MRSKTSRGEGLVPRWGGGGAWQNPPCQFAVPSHNPRFSYLGVQAPAGMSDWYESMSRTPIRDEVTWPRDCPSATAPALVVPAPQFVIPAKAGIHALTFRERTSTAKPPPTSTRRPHFVFPAKAPPEPRYGAGIQRGVGGANFHTLVCRPLPASAIGTKACPGLRSGMMVRGLGCACIPRLPHSFFRPPFVIPAKAGIQKGRGETTTRMRNTQTDHHFHPSMWPSGEMCVPSSYRSNSFCQSRPHRHQNSVGPGPRMAGPMIFTRRILKHQNRVP